MHIIQLNAAQAKELMEQLKYADSKSLWSLRVSVEGDSVKFKINAGMWSPPMGQLDPESEEAYARRQLSNEPVVQDDQRAYEFDCDTCNSRPGQKCTEATEKGRKKMAYIHTDRITKLRNALEYENDAS